MKILVAGFQHETNTFAPTRAGYDNFVRGEGFPAMARGADVFALRDVNIPMGGFILAAEAAGHTLLPVIWAGASPSAHVTRDAYERIAGEIVAAARVTDADAIYLDLHGAMVAEHVDDGEGELLARVRQAVGAAMPVVASLDLHANVTARMLENADALVAYRTYPHVDMAATGARAAALLERLLGGRPLYRAARRLPFLIPINGMCTLLEPSRGMYARLEQLEQGGVASLSFAPGFPAADFPECGPVIWGHADDAATAQAAVDALYDRMLGEEGEWAVPFLSPDDAVIEAMRLSDTAQAGMAPGAGATTGAATGAATGAGPVVIADTQDNPGAGADANTTGMLRALLRHGARDAAIGLLWDADAARAAHAAGVGAQLDLMLGGTSGAAGDAPFAGRFEVVFLSDGRCRYDGPMFHGMETDLGPSACLRIDGVRVAVSSVKTQMLDRNLYRMVGIEPERMKILVNKSSVHFRADFAPIAAAVLVAKAPGPMNADPGDLPWRHLTPGIRMRPNGPAFAG